MTSPTPAVKSKQTDQPKEPEGLYRPASGALLRICLAVVTHRRQQQLEQLLGHLLRIRRPANCQLYCLVIDNDRDRSAESVCADFVVRTKDSLSYYVEAERGIPLARNRALREAARLKADVLVFIDDDEVPAPDWLAKLIDQYRETGSDLIGGPVRMKSESNLALTPWQRVVHRSTAAWVNRKAHRSDRNARLGRVVAVVTNNWLGDIRFIIANDLSFDPGYSSSGSSDTAFFRAAVKRGARCGWCSEAIVYDQLPVDRISLRYQFRRARAQSINHFHQRHPNPDNAMRMRTISVAVVRIAIGAVAIVIPFSGTASLVRGIRSIGWGVGRVDALAGKRSEFYNAADR